MHPLHATAPVTFIQRIMIRCSGRWQSVQTLAQRNAIPDALRKKGMAVYVADSLKTYILANGINNGNWAELPWGQLRTYLAISQNVLMNSNSNDSALSIAANRLAIEKSGTINPAAFGVYNNDSTQDSGPGIQAAIDYAQANDLPQVRMPLGNYFIDSIRIRTDVTFILPHGSNLYSKHANFNDSNYHMILPEDSSSLYMYGFASLNKRIGSIVYLDGKKEVFRSADTKLHLNMKGNNMYGQKGLEFLADGHGVYGSAPVSYMDDISIIAHDLDYWLYGRAIRNGNANNLVIKIEAGGTINGIYLYSDTSKVWPAGTGKTTIAYTNIEGNIRVGKSTKRLMYLDGINDAKMSMKLEDYGRYSDTLPKQPAVTITSPSEQNTFVFKGFKPQWIANYSSSSSIDSHVGTGTAAPQDISPSNYSIYPNGTLARFTGGDDFLLGTNHGKPGFVATTTSNTTDNLKKIISGRFRPFF